MQIMIEGDKLLELIPQRSPIVMIDSFFGIKDDCSLSGLTVMAENIFFEDGHLREPGIIEHIAQSAAARAGYLYTQQNQPIPLGFIGSLDKMNIYFLPKEGDQLLTEIRIIQEVFGITLVSGVTKVNELIVAECKMKISLQN
ncbi:MAG: hydroxymyristoyl-ACP dehydratase [Dysgonomonas sp.]|nr:hydroxymyristoyl-ACP dehydratase [Dysgonomonas sp.]